MPLVALDASRLILVKSSVAANAAAAVCNHIVETHGDDIRYAMCSSSEDALGLMDTIVDVLQKKRFGTLPTARSAALQAVERSESGGDAAFRALEARDYVLRGTQDGAASLIIAHESVIDILLARAANLEAEMDVLPCGDGTDDVPVVSVLDFGVGSFPYMVADNAPIIQPQWNLDDA